MMGERRRCRAILLTIWTGIGALGAFIVGIASFGEAMTFMRVTSAVLIVSGLVMMKLATPT
jgi:quaternary ammonium compound-resistance protein SugE